MQLMPGEAPSGWEPEDPLQFTSYVGMEGWHCDRFSLGSFERPVWFLVEVHNRAAIPEQCRPDTQGNTYTGIVSNFFVSDAELAQFLNRTYGLRAHVAEIKESIQDQGAFESHDWTWTPQGMAPSTMSILDDGNPVDSLDNYYRYYWENGAGIVFLELKVETTEPIFTNRAAHGSLEAPMLLADWYTDGAFAGPGDWFPAATGEGTFQFFADHECTKPVPP